MKPPSAPGRRIPWTLHIWTWICLAWLWKDDHYQPSPGSRTLSEACMTRPTMPYWSPVACTPATGAMECLPTGSPLYPHPWQRWWPHHHQALSQPSYQSWSVRMPCPGKAAKNTQKKSPSASMDDAPMITPLRVWRTHYPLQKPIMPTRISQLS